MNEKWMEKSMVGWEMNKWEIRYEWEMNGKINGWMGNE